MTKSAIIDDFDRITFFNGQSLTAADLTELQHANRELRWLHNRSLHRWGIGLGLGVNGDRGETSISVEPGYGIDCLGREIILTQQREIPVPAVAGSPGGQEAVYYLIAAYQADSEQHVAERRPGVCQPAGTVRLQEEPRLEWRRSEQLDEGVELILAQAWIRNCQLSRPLSLTARRSARPEEQPYIGSGQTQAGETQWSAWDIDNRTVGVLTYVDTSSHRFRYTPQYQAHVVGERLRTNESGSILYAGFPSVAEATPQGFTLQIILPALASGINPFPSDPQEISALGWHVVWMGIEL